jgi:hypothetical protein
MSWPLDMTAWEEFAKLAPIATAAIAAAAACIAYTALRVQRDLARKRAALDFFLKTEMDKSVVEALYAYEDAMKRFEAHGDAKTLCGNTDDYRSICTYLNINELIAIGVDKKLLDEDLSFEFWSDELIVACDDAKAIIAFVRKQDKTPFSYVTLESVGDRWVQRDEKERRRLGVPADN